MCLLFVVCCFSVLCVFVDLCVVVVCWLGQVWKTVVGCDDDV